MSTKQMLDYVYENESKHANKLWLTQPIGGGQVKGTLGLRPLRSSKDGDAS